MRLSLIISIVFIALYGPGALASEAPQQSIGQDLTATIALHGAQCDKVVDSKRNSDSDYVATCQDGNRYHIYVDARGRVVVQKI